MRQLAGLLLRKHCRRWKDRMQRKPRFRIEVFTLVAACAVAGVVGLRARTVLGEPAAPTPCVQYWPVVVYRNLGYDHIVHLFNRCNERAVCLVASDVNPTPVDVSVSGNQHVEVLTMRGSPAREFTPKVDCELRPE